MLSQGEYVLPADVVKWYGLKHIMSMQEEEAEEGLMAMDAMGLIAEVDMSEPEEGDSEEETMETPEGNEVEMGFSGSF